VTVAPSEVAAHAATWDQLVTYVSGCVACPELASARTRVVPGVRPPDADVLLVGEAPGAQEDAAGVPFVGRSGLLLDTLLGEAGLPRERVAVTNVLKCRPPRNRTPLRGEVASCRPWLARQIELVDPLLVVTLGGSAAAWFFGPSARIGVLRQAEQHAGGRPVLVTYHPSAAIRFGPAGAPRAALAEDLARAAGRVAELRELRQLRPERAAGD
jgi:DNA polymerase